MIADDMGRPRSERVEGRQTLAQLRQTDVALAGKNQEQPVIVFRHGRWHMLSIGWVADAALRLKRGIVSVHFMSRRRAAETVAEWLPYSELRVFAAVCPAFAEELAAKVLPLAEAYRPLVRGGWVALAGGQTTDTLASQAAGGGLEDELIASIERWMQAGQPGPFLHFRRTYQVIRDAVAQG
jgi:hypothetical protein